MLNEKLKKVLCWFVCVCVFTVLFVVVVWVPLLKLAFLFALFFHEFSVELFDMCASTWKSLQQSLFLFIFLFPFSLWLFIFPFNLLSALELINCDYHGNAVLLYCCYCYCCYCFLCLLFFCCVEYANNYFQLDIQLMHHRDHLQVSNKYKKNSYSSVKSFEILKINS